MVRLLTILLLNRIEDPVNDIFKTKFNRRRIRVGDIFLSQHITVMVRARDYV